ncbi:hypothetical protein EJ05DRAFT_473972 [Pseudovirgaria hyperparasitica]|uniref:Uncharacterized protein n=1 Tax=Pseudovirgaria hyperparasitica TaxID=470096 RepID=A0A6A6WHK6_9PEZI|nr:uncharacterized protein EJ05DRAFT_473972 [Pseudovirgaria hyperparasitica]KAF2761476.1 hypothetical protein EJ05DRAFT_473972 [Pseudovirgaria hyperparasitica]
MDNVAGPNSSRRTSDNVSNSLAPTISNGNSKSPSLRRRSPSGSFLSRIPFLKSSEENRSAKTSGNDHHEQSETEQNEEKRGGSLSQALRQVKPRNRKGSLRKTAILGTGNIKLQGRERKNSLRSRPSEAQDYTTNAGEATSARRLPYMNNASTSSSENNFVNTIPQSLSSMFVKDDNAYEREPLTPNQTLSPITSPESANTYMSTTDDDTDSSTFSRPPVIPGGMVPSQQYFPLPLNTALARKRSVNRAHPSQSSPLSRPPVTVEDDYDYSETEWWGWVILMVTWIVFVVGMGSCFGIWSWAWDVGETPYAPPELENDETLPIVGYYPALIVLTGIMAWVWVVTAWVGMKYFRHARVMAEEG